MGVHSIMAKISLDVDANAQAADSSFHRQLLVDTIKNARSISHYPIKRQIVTQPDHPWEERLILNRITDQAG